MSISARLENTFLEKTFQQKFSFYKPSCDANKTSVSSGTLETCRDLASVHSNTKVPLFLCISRGYCHNLRCQLLAPPAISDINTCLTCAHDKLWQLFCWLCKINVFKITCHTHSVFNIHVVFQVYSTHTKQDMMVAMYLSYSSHAPPDHWSSVAV